MNQISRGFMQRMAPGSMAGQSRVATMATRSAGVSPIAASAPATPIVPFVSVYFDALSTGSMSAFTNTDWGQEAGNFMFNMLFTYGNATFLGSSEEPAWTPELATLAPSAPHRAYGWSRTANGDSGDDGQFWSWDSPGVEAASLTIAAQESGLGLWTQDWWDGPDTVFLVNYEVHRSMVVWVRSDAGSIVADASLIFRATDPPWGSPSANIGVVEAWSIPGVSSPNTTFIDIDVVATGGGDLQWITWADLYSV